MGITQCQRRDGLDGEITELTSRRVSDGVAKTGLNQILHYGIWHELRPSRLHVSQTVLRSPRRSTSELDGPHLLRHSGQMQRDVAEDDLATQVVTRGVALDDEDAWHPVGQLPDLAVVLGVSIDRRWMQDQWLSRQIRVPHR